MGEGRPEGASADPGQHPELNAVFCTADPAEVHQDAVESLSLMACTDEQLGPAFAAERTIGTTYLGPMSTPPQEARQRYIRMESVMVAHHASEALLRLFLAHVEHPECPWLGMSASTDFRDFKAAVNTILGNGCEREQIAMVFLGGTSPQDACIQLSDQEFEDAIDALDMLLFDCASRCLGDSSLQRRQTRGHSGRH